MHENVRIIIIVKNKIMKKWDKEYSTQLVEEMKFLLEHNIKYTFVKVVNGITTYKYTKTSELFKLLAIFYAEKRIIY